MSLASRLPYDHAFAGGYPGIGSQPLPTDADALDYLSRVKAADGAGVEVGVATAVSAFFRDTKAAGVFSSLKACCILAGARTLAGALVPVVGDAPTNVANGFVSGDYTRGGATPGLKGDGTSYLDSGRAVNADGDADHHAAAYITAGTLVSGEYAIGAMSTASTYTIAGYGMYSRSSANAGLAEATAGLAAIARSSSSSFEWKKSGNDAETAVVSATAATLSNNHLVFAYNNAAASATGISDSTIAFYSIGTSLSLADLDTAVSNLITAIGEAI